MTTNTILIIWAASAVFAGLIGQSKGRGGEGVVLGLLLGVIGVIIALTLKPAVAQLANPAGWWPDPRGRHQLRFWDGDIWTTHVSDDGIQSTD